MSKEIKEMKEGDEKSKYGMKKILKEKNSININKKENDI